MSNPDYGVLQIQKAISDTPRWEIYGRRVRLAGENVGWIDYREKSIHIRPGVSTARFLELSKSVGSTGYQPHIVVNDYDYWDGFIEAAKVAGWSVEEKDGEHVLSGEGREVGRFKFDYGETDGYIYAIGPLSKSMEMLADQYGIKYEMKDMREVAKKTPETDPGLQKDLGSIGIRVVPNSAMEGYLWGNNDYVGDYSGMDVMLFGSFLGTDTSLARRAEPILKRYGYNVEWDSRKSVRKDWNPAVDGDLVRAVSGSEIRDYSGDTPPIKIVWKGVSLAAYNPDKRLYHAFDEAPSSLKSAFRMHGFREVSYPELGGMGTLDSRMGKSAVRKAFVARIVGDDLILSRDGRDLVILSRTSNQWDTFAGVDVYEEEGLLDELKRRGYKKSVNKGEYEFGQDLGDIGMYIDDGDPYRAKIMSEDGNVVAEWGGGGYLGRGARWNIASSATASQRRALEAKAREANYDIGKSDVRKETDDEWQDRMARGNVGRRGRINVHGEWEYEDDKEKGYKSEFMRKGFEGAFVEGLRAQFEYVKQDGEHLFISASDDSEAEVDMRERTIHYTVADPTEKFVSMIERRFPGYRVKSHKSRFVRELAGGLKKFDGPEDAADMLRAGGFRVFYRNNETLGFETINASKGSVSGTAYIHDGYFEIEGQRSNPDFNRLFYAFKQLGLRHMG